MREFYLSIRLIVTLMFVLAFTVLQLISLHGVENIRWLGVAELAVRYGLLPSLIAGLIFLRTSQAGWSLAGFLASPIFVTLIFAPGLPRLLEIGALNFIAINYDSIVRHFHYLLLLINLMPLIRARQKARHRVVMFAGILAAVAVMITEMILAWGLPKWGVDIGISPFVYLEHGMLNAVFVLAIPLGISAYVFLRMLVVRDEETIENVMPAQVKTLESQF